MAFKVGDRVEVVDTGPNPVKLGETGTVESVEPSTYHGALVDVHWDVEPHDRGPLFEERLKLAPPDTVSYPIAFKPLLDAAIALASAVREGEVAGIASDEAARAAEAADRREMEARQAWSAAVREAAKL